MKGFRLWTDFRWIVRAAGHISIPVGWIAGWQAGRIDHFLIWQKQVPAMAYVPYQEFAPTFELKKALQVGTIFPELCKPVLRQERRKSMMSGKLYFQKRTVAVYWPGKLCHWRSSPFSGYASKRKKSSWILQWAFSQKKWAPGKICKILWTADHWYRKRQQS